MAVPLGLDVSKIPPPHGGLHFDSEGRSFFVEMSQVDPAELTVGELQEMVTSRNHRPDGKD